MKLELKSLTLKNFKGVKDKAITFDGNTRVLGANAQGKSTLADGWYWLWNDCNTALVKNPPITPIGESECISRVEAELEIDGKPLQIAKSQKFKTKEVEGKTTTAVANGYEINSVDKSYKDFITDLTEHGIDMDNFLIFSHPQAFTSDTSKQGREKMRSLLFKMCEDTTDANIASEMTDIDELEKLLDSYKLDEIEQMNKATIKKITEKMGKDNAVVNARIEEVLSQKSTLDAKVLEEQKANYEAEIKRIDEELSGNNKNKIEHISELRIQKSKMESKAQAKLNEKKADFDRKLREAMMQRDENQRRMLQYDSDIKKIETVLENNRADLEKQRKLYKLEQDSVLDEDSTICPVCKREYDADKISEIKAEFEENKAKRLKVIEESGKTLKAEIKANEEGLKSTQNLKTVLQKTIDDYQLAVDEIQKKIDEIPTQADMSKNKIYLNICKEIKEFDSAASDKSRLEELRTQKNVNQQMLNQVIAELGSLEKNKELDERVAELRKERKEAEINKAKAEKILDQVTRFKMFKNNKLSEMINSHFEDVEFVFWEVLKNGSINETLKVLIGGKEIQTQVNQATQVLAKLDIIRGLSDFFEMWMPVFCDDYALITSESDSRIKMKNQLIKLIAKDGVKGLKVERG